jgi:hypothetical protein
MAKSAKTAFWPYMPFLNKPKNVQNKRQRLGEQDVQGQMKRANDARALTIPRLGNVIAAGDGSEQVKD